jgi:hypothetical protein
MWTELRSNWILFLDDVYFAWRSVVDWFKSVWKFVSPNPPTEEQMKFVRALANDVQRVK